MALKSTWGWAGGILLLLAGACSSPNGPTSVSQTTTAPVAAACTFTIADSQLSVTIDANGGDLTIAVATDSGCYWTVTNGSDFIKVNSNGTNAGPGSVRLTVASNPGAERLATVMIAGKTATIRQLAVPPTPCAFSVSPLVASVDAGGGTVTVAVTVTQGGACPWTAISNTAFLSIGSGKSGSGDGTVTAAVPDNGGAARTGTLTIAGQTVTISQAAHETSPPQPQPCAFAVSPITISAGAIGATFAITVTVTQGMSCAWTASTSDVSTPSSSAFITIVSGASGSGNGVVTFLTATNQAAARSGALIVAGRTVTVSQAAGGPVAVLTFRSDRGDYIGGGQSRSFTVRAPALTSSVDSAHNHVTVGTPSGEFWYLDFAAPSGRDVAPGMYNDAERWPFQVPSQPGLSMVFNGRGCDTVTGRFLVAEALYVPPNKVQRFHAAFEQHCENSSAALVGDIWIDGDGILPNSLLPPLPPAPSTPRSFLSFTSDSGDWVGGGQSRTYDLSTATFRPLTGARPGAAEISLYGFDSTYWYLALAAPAGQPLMPGVYESATRYPVEAPTVPGLDFNANGRGCNTLTGRFQVFEVSLGPGGEVKRLHATFEQHCEGAVPALRGEIWVVADPWR